MSLSERTDALSEAPTERIAKSRISLEDFNDIDAAAIIRDLNIHDDNEDDLERQIDFDYNDQNDDKFKNELLFYVQGLGSIKQHGEIEFYMKGPHCEDSLKDLIRMCKRDDEDCPAARLELGKWSVLQNDLLHLLVTQHQDKKLTFYLMILLVLLTEYPKKGCTRTAEMIDYLQNYKLAFAINENVIQTINMHLADCLSVQESERSKAHDQMIELIITLYRNLLKVPDAEKDVSDRFKKNLQLRFIDSLHKQSSLDAFIFIVQQASSTMMKKISLTLLEIFFYILIPFEPKWLFKNPNEDKSLLQRFREKEQRERMIRLSQMSSRHARFDCNIKVVRKLGGAPKVIHNPFKQNIEDAIPQQLHKPKKRKVEEKNRSIFPKNFNEELIVGNALVNDEIEGDSLKKVMRDYAVDFIEHAYDKMIEELYEEIYKGSERIDEIDKIHYLMVMAYGLEVARYSYHYYRELRKRRPDIAGNKGEDFDIASVGAALQLTVNDMLQSFILKEVTKQTKSTFSVRIFHAAFHCFLELMYCIKEMRMATSSTTRKNAQILMQKIFTQDNSRLLKMGFNHYNPEVHDPRLGETLVEFLGIFFELLEEYSKGKILKIQTDQRMIKKKIKTNKKEKAKKERAKNKKNLNKKRREKAKKERAKAKPKRGENEENNNTTENGQTPNPEAGPESTLEPTLQIEGSTLENMGALASTLEEVGMEIMMNKEGENQDEDKEESEHLTNNEEDVDGDEEDENESIPEEESDSDDDDDEGDYVGVRERIVNFASELAFLADYRVIDIIIKMIRPEKLETNEPAINQAIARYIKKVCTTLKADWLFFQIDYLIVFQEILNISNPKILMENHLLVETIRAIVKSFFELMKKNSLLGVECLFRFANKIVKDEILNNYQPPVVDETREEADPFRDLLPEEDEGYRRGETVGPQFNEKVDLILIQNFEEFKDFDDCETQLCILLNKMGITEYTDKDIKKRLKILKVRLGKEKAMEVFNSIYKDDLQITIEHALRQALTLIDTSRFSKDNLKTFLVSFLQRFIAYKKEFATLSEETGNLSAPDMAILPLTVQDFDILEWECIPMLFQSMHLRPPGQGEIYWRVPGFLTENEIEILIEKIDKYFENEGLLEEAIKSRIEEQRRAAQPEVTPGGETDYQETTPDGEQPMEPAKPKKKKRVKAQKKRAEVDADEGENDNNYAEDDNNEGQMESQHDEEGHVWNEEDEEEGKSKKERKSRKKNRLKKFEKSQGGAESVAEAGEEMIEWLIDDEPAEENPEREELTESEEKRRKKKAKKEKKEKKKKRKEEKRKKFLMESQQSEMQEEEPGTQNNDNEEESVYQTQTQTQELEEDEEQDSDKENQKPKKSRLRQAFQRTRDHDEVPEEDEEYEEENENNENVRPEEEEKGFEEEPIRNESKKASRDKDILREIPVDSTEKKPARLGSMKQEATLGAEEEIPEINERTTNKKKPVQETIKASLGADENKIIRLKKETTRESLPRDDELVVKEEFVMKIEDEGPVHEITPVKATLTTQGSDMDFELGAISRKEYQSSLPGTGAFPTLSEDEDKHSYLKNPQKPVRSNDNSNSIQMFLVPYEAIKENEIFHGSNSQSQDESYIIKFYNRTQSGKAIEKPNKSSEINEDSFKSPQLMPDSPVDDRENKDKNQKNTLTFGANDSDEEHVY